MNWEPKQIKLDQKGVAKVLGEREAQIMNVVWEKSDVSVRDVCIELCKQRNFSFNTIMTIMNRLTKKGLLNKKSRNGIFCYSATMPKKEFLGKTAEDILINLFKDSQIFNKETVGKITKHFPHYALKVIGKNVRHQ